MIKIKDIFNEQIFDQLNDLGYEVELDKPMDDPDSKKDGLQINFEFKKPCGDQDPVEKATSGLNNAVTGKEQVHDATGKGTEFKGIEAIETSPTNETDKKPVGPQDPLSKTTPEIKVPVKVEQQKHDVFESKIKEDISNDWAKAIKDDKGNDASKDVIWKFINPLMDTKMSNEEAVKKFNAWYKKNYTDKPRESIIEINGIKYKLAEGEEAPLDTNITQTIQKPVGSQDPTHNDTAGTATMPVGTGNDKTPDSVITNIETPKGAEEQYKLTPIAKGPQDAPTKATSEVTTMPSAESVVHESIIDINGIKYKLIEDVPTTNAIIGSAIKDGNSGEAINHPVPESNAIPTNSPEVGIPLTLQVSSENTNKTPEQPIVPVTTLEVPVTESIKFVIYNKKPCAILSESEKTYTILEDAETGDTKEIDKDKIEDCVDEKGNALPKKAMNQTTESYKDKPIHIALEETEITLRDGRILTLEKNDKFIIL